MQQGQTLQEIADKCGFTRSLLSKIETGRTLPPIATLAKISQTLGISLSSLLKEGSNDQPVYTSAKLLNKKAFSPTNKGYLFHAFASGLPEKAIQPFLFIAQKGNIKKEALSHVGEEFVYVLEGKMRYRVGNIEYILDQGDSLYFDAEDEHELEPISKKVKFLAVFVERQKKKYI